MTIADKIVSIPVRIVSPRIGIFKGLLAAKHGIDKIQLPGSMKKVGKSKVVSRDNEVYFSL